MRYTSRKRTKETDSSIKYIYIYHKRSVLRRQSRDTNRNIKRSMNCQYGQYDLTFRALALHQRERAYARNVRPYYPVLAVHRRLYILYIYIYSTIYRYVFRCSTAHQCSLVQSGYGMPTIYTQVIVSGNRACGTIAVMLECSNYHKGSGLCIIAKGHYIYRVSQKKSKLLK